MDRNAARSIFNALPATLAAIRVGDRSPAVETAANALYAAAMAFPTELMFMAEEDRDQVMAIPRIVWSPPAPVVEVEAAPDAAANPTPAALPPVGRTMAAKFSGSCRACGARYDVGAAILWNRDNGVYGCPRCGGRAVEFFNSVKKFCFADFAPLWTEMESVAQDAIPAWIATNKPRMAAATAYFREYPEAMALLTEEQRRFLPIMARKSR